MAGHSSLIRGIVRDPQGRPVAQARVYFRAGPGALPDIAALTGSDGSFALTAPVPGTYTIEAAADGFAPGAATVTVAGGEERRLDIELRAP